MANWTPQEEERIESKVSELLEVSNPRIRGNHLAKLRRAIKENQGKTALHQRQGQSGQPFRREARILKEIVHRVEQALIETEREEDT